MEKLDRILVSLSSEHMFALVYMRVIPRNICEHSPLVLHFIMSQLNVERPFKFELCWFLGDDRDPLVNKISFSYLCCWCVLEK